MHALKCLFLSLLCLSSVKASEIMSSDYYQLKLKLNRMGYLMKIEKEAQAIQESGKYNFDFFSSEAGLQKSLENLGPNFNLACVEWVYQGPGTREDAVRACQGVKSMECVEFVYGGPSSRQESAQACKGVRLHACVEWVYQGPGSRLEAAHACRGVRDMSCLEFVYRGSATRMQAAQTCSEGSRDRDYCE